jgi:hypothetical protein
MARKELGCDYIVRCSYSESVVNPVLKPVARFNGSSFA